MELVAGAILVLAATVLWAVGEISDGRALMAYVVAFMLAAAGVGMMLGWYVRTTPDDRTPAPPPDEPRR